MEFTCPHCHKSFQVTLRKASTSDKANAARKRNGALGGHNKLDAEDVLRVYHSQSEPWKGEEFKAALKAKTGVDYSRARAFALLQKVKAGAFDEYWTAIRMAKATPKKKTIPR